MKDMINPEYRNNDVKAFNRYLGSKACLFFIPRLYVNSKNFHALWSLQKYLQTYKELGPYIVLHLEDNIGWIDEDVINASFIRLCLLI